MTDFFLPVSSEFAGISEFSGMVGPCECSMYVPRGCPRNGVEINESCLDPNSDFYKNVKSLRCDFPTDGITDTDPCADCIFRHRTNINDRVYFEPVIVYLPDDTSTTKLCNQTLLQRALLNNLIANSPDNR